MSKKANIDEIKEYINNKYKIRYNVIANSFEYYQKPKSSLIKNFKPNFKKHDFKQVEIIENWENLNENNILIDLHSNFYSISMQNLLTLFKSDFVQPYNPFKSYFEKLPAHNGTDYIGNLSKYIVLRNEKKDRKRFDAMFKKMFVRTVACSLEIKLNKQCLVLVHDKQNSGKTTFLRWLVPFALENYYAENISTDKDSQIALAENFIINLDELSTMSKQDINALKSMMSKDNIKERVPYDRKPSLMKRRCSFVGSTNKTEFLTDETGNVRWLCFEIDRIVWDYKKDFDVNNIWVQSFHLLKTNFDFELSKDEIFDNEIANKEFMVRTPEMELIMRYFEKSDKNDLTAVFLSSTEIQKEISTKIFNTVRINPNNVGKALKILGFEKQTKYDTNLRFSVFGYYVRFRNADMNVNNSLNEIMNDFCEPVQN